MLRILSVVVVTLAACSSQRTAPPAGPATEYHITVPPLGVVDIVCEDSSYSSTYKSDEKAEKQVVIVKPGDHTCTTSIKPSLTRLR